MGSARKPLAHRAASGALWVSVQNWGNQLVRFAVFLILARLLGPEAFGILTLAAIVTVLGERLIAEGGWSEALIRKRQLHPADLDSVFWFLVGASLAFVGCAVALAASAADWFDQPEIALILPWLAWVMPLYAFNVVPRALLQRRFDFRNLAMASLVGTVGGGLTAVALALTGWGIWSLVFYQLVQTSIRTVLIWRVSPWRPGGQVAMARLKETIGFASGVLTERALRSIDIIAARALMGQQLSATTLGYYGFALEILGLTRRLLVRPLTGVALPAIAALRSEPARLRAALMNGIQFLALMAFPGPIGLAIVAPDLVPLLVGERWAPAVPAVQIAMVLGPLVPLTRLSVVLQLAVGRVRTVAGLAALSTTIFLVLLLLQEHLTVETVLVALVVRSYLVFPLHLALMQRLTGISIMEYLRALAPLLASCLVMAAAVLATLAVLPSDLAPFWRLCASVTVGVIAYVAALTVTARPLLAEAARLLAGALDITTPGARGLTPGQRRPREARPR